MRVYAEGADSGSKYPRLAFFKELFERTKTQSRAYQDELQQNMAQYEGDKSIDPLPGSQYAQDAKVVRNITYELIEAQIDSSIPAARVDPSVDNNKNRHNAKAVEMLCAKWRNEHPLEELNDLDERRTYIYGGDWFLVEWDNSVKTHNTVGDIRISLLSPDDVFVPPNIYRTEDLEYAFVRTVTTRDDLVRRYDITYEEAAACEFSDATDREDTSEDNTVSVITCFYRNEEDRISKYSFSGEVELEDLDNYYSRKKRLCTVCGKRSELCSCEAPSFEWQNEEYEELTHDVPTSGVGSDGNQIVIPAKSPVLKDDGKMEGYYETYREQSVGANGGLLMDPLTGLPAYTTKERFIPKMEPTRLPYYQPRTLPLILRRNVTADKKLLGQSDCKTIRQQQQNVNKYETRILEKMMRAGVTPVLPEDTLVKNNDTVFGTVIRLRPGENKGQYGIVDTTPDISQDLAMIERQYDEAKRILGLTDSYLGQYDASAQSGKAKQIQVEQAAGRLQSKRRLKQAAYSTIDRAVFEMFLAFADEPRPVPYYDEFGELQNAQFNRYDFLEKDTFTGEYYYNDAYLFSVDASAGLEQNRTVMWETCAQNLSNGSYGALKSPLGGENAEAYLYYWLDLEKYGYPNAGVNVQRWRRKYREQKQQMQMMARQQATGQQASEQQAAQQQQMAQNGQTAQTQAQNGGI